MHCPAAALVAWRNRKATILRMVAPFLFLLLALLINKALQANTSTSTSYQDLQNPQPQQLGSIPKCTDDLYIGNKPCTEILFSPNNTVAQVCCSISVHCTVYSAHVANGPRGCGEGGEEAGATVKGGAISRGLFDRGSTTCPGLVDLCIIPYLQMRLLGLLHAPCEGSLD